MTELLYQKDSYLKEFNSTTHNVDPQNNSIILTQSMAKKFFSNEDPIGKVLQINNEINDSFCAFL